MRSILESVEKNKDMAMISLYEADGMWDLHEPGIRDVIEKARLQLESFKSAQFGACLPGVPASLWLALTSTP